MKKNIITMLSISTVVGVIVFVFGMFLYDMYYGIERYKYETVSTVNANENYTILSGVIRNTGEGWFLIKDENHEPIGINDISQDSESITIWYDKMDKINSISTTVDETMSSEGYKVGASVGTDKTVIFIYDKNENLVNPSNYSNGSGNIWIQGIFKK